MSDFYLGNGNKRPKLEDYKRAFGVNAQFFASLQASLKVSSPF